MNPLDLLTDESKRKFQEIVIEAMKGEKTFFSAEYEIRTKNGQSVWGLFYARVNCKDGKPDTVKVFVQDITERKKAEEALREEKQRLQSILDAMNDGIVLIGLDGKVTDCNDASLKQLGFTREEVSGKNITDFMFPEDKKSSIMEASSEVRKTGKALVEVRILRKNKSVFPAEISITAFYNKNRKPVALLGVARDITERKRTEEACEEPEERFRSLVETTSDWIWQVDQNAVYTYASPKIKDILGYTPDEVLGRTPFDLMPHEEAEKIAKEFEEIAKKKIPFHGLENWNRHKNGNPVLLETSGVPILDTAGRLTGYRGIDRDITERKEAEERLRSSEARYRSLFENSLDGIMLTIPDGTVISANPAFQRMMGMTEDEIKKTGRAGMMIMDKRAAESIRQREKTGKFQAEMTLKHKDGSTFEAEITSNMFRDADGIEKTGMILRDITERKKMEEELRKSEQLYRTVFDNSDDGFQLVELICDENDKPLDERILLVNRAFEKQTGFKANELVGKKVSELNPSRETHWSDKHYEVLKSGKSTHVEVYVHYAKRYFDAYVFPYSGAVVGILFRDITERKKAEKALRVEKKRFESIASSLPEIVFETDDKGKVFFGNKRGFEITGYTQEDFARGINVFSLIAPKDKEKAIEHFNRILKNQPTIDNEYTVVRKDGSTFPAIIVASAIFDNERPIGLRGLVIDITERKKEEERYRQLFSSMTELFFVAELSYNEKGRAVDFVYVEANPAFLNSLGKRSDEVVGKRAKELLGSVGIEDFLLEELSRIDKTGKAFHGEQLSKRTSKFYDVSAWKIDNSRVGVIFEDITKRKTLEKQLQDNERMATIGQTAGMVGHDIRNPLQAIISELYLTKGIIGESPESKEKQESLESVNFIEEQVNYINKIVSDLQDFARQLNPEYSIVNLPDLIVSVFDTIALPEKINLKVDIARTLKLKTDPTFIQRALTNLVNNAVQAMPDGGELGLSAHKQEKCVVICVSDTGQGIPEHVRANLFKPLMTTKAKGQGLGLAVVKRLVEALNGKVSFESQEGKGTKFIIELPTP